MPSRFSQTTRALNGDTARYAIVVWGLTGLLLVVWLVWFLFDRVVVYEVSNRARLEVRQAPHHVAALLPSRVVSVNLEIGRDVQAGDVLVDLDARTETLRLQEEEARLVVLPQRVASLRREVEARRREREEDWQSALAAVEVARFRGREAELAFDFAKENERRVVRLGTLGSASMVDMMRVATEAQKLAATRDALAADIRRIERDAHMRAAQHDAQIEALEQSIVLLDGDARTTRATIERLRSDIEKHKVRAPISGRLGDVVPLHAGAYVAQGQRLATVVPPGDLIIVADFAPSVTLGRVRAGQTARLRLDSYPWVQYGVVSASVTRVASEIRDNFVRVEFAIKDVPYSGIVIQHGLPGSIEVAVETTSPRSLALRAAGFLLPATVRAAQGAPR